MIEAGAAGVRFGPARLREEMRAHGWQGLDPLSPGVRNLISARLAADVMSVPTVIIARTDADAAASSPATWIRPTTSF